MTEPTFCLIIPHFNHHEQFEGALPRFESADLSIVIVDDGSEPESLARIRELIADKTDIHLVVHEVNRGKGAAIVTGIVEAGRLGFTHGIQIDADGQHDLGDLPKFLAESRREPGAIVSGKPVYGDDIPISRKRGRKFAHIWVNLETLSTRVEDAMCGYRVYPVDVVERLKDKCKFGWRMPFDTEILIRADWAGVPLIFVPTEVTYPEDGLSHYKMWRDNVQVVGMHVLLVLGMVPRSPKLLWRQLRRSDND